MLVGVHQTILNPKKFWEAVDEIVPHLPSGLRVISVVPSMDGKICTGLWECDTAEHMQRFMDKNWGEYAKTRCFEVDSNRAIGLKQVTVGQAS